MKRVRPPLTPLRGGPFQIELEALFQKPKGVPFALTRVPRADNRTEILSPTNKQYNGRKRALRAFQGRIIRRRYYLLPTNFAFGTWVARLIAAPLNQRATTSEWTALNDFEELEMKCYVILPFPHSSEALWGPQYCRYLASALPKNQEFSGAPRFYLPIRGQFQEPFGRSKWFQDPSDSPRGGPFRFLPPCKA